MKPYTEVGCEAYIVRDGNLLMGLRSNIKFGGGTWGLPGGHLKFMERADVCIARELKEELGVNVKSSDMQFLAVTDGADAPSGSKSHHVHITFKVDIGAQTPKNCEPAECEELKWFPLDSLPKNILPPHALILETINSGQVYKFIEDING
jgi:8-oxo-dGTP diphosphatase